MKRTPTLLAGALWMGALCVAAQAEGTPKIQFDQTLYDFGKTSQVATVSGVFKFKNAGDGILKVEPPKPSCGCTVAEVKPNTLPPGATGELPFTLNLGLSRATLEKHIAVRSNDPQTPEVSLVIKADYTPLYELSPITLTPNLAFGVNATAQTTTLTRTDGKPLRIARLAASKAWITATVEPSAQADETTARIRVAIQRDGLPRRFNEYVHVYAGEQTNTPVSSIYLYGQVLGEVSLSPEVLYWSITDAAKRPAAVPEELSTRRVTIRSASGQTFELKNPQSTLKDIKVELVPKEAGKVYELIARLDDVPASTVSGNVSFETSVAAQSRIELPVIVNVFKP
ncbi:MAG: DUF1573 domain-containing protein [Verrucomicrobiota bacterium]